MKKKNTSEDLEKDQQSIDETNYEILLNLTEIKTLPTNANKFGIEY